MINKIIYGQHIDELLLASKAGMLTHFTTRSYYNQDFLIIKVRWRIYHCDSEIHIIMG